MVLRIPPSDAVPRGKAVAGWPRREGPFPRAVVGGDRCHAMGDVCVKIKVFAMRARYQTGCRAGWPAGAGFRVRAEALIRQFL